MKKNKLFKIAFYKNDWTFQTIIKKTKKEALAKEKEYFDDSQPRPATIIRGWVII